jgi:hypothetical protein
MPLDGIIKRNEKKNEIKIIAPGEFVKKEI